ncbi:MAG: hypothetical protein ABI073_03235 [Luteolibacter sp.]
MENGTPPDIQSLLIRLGGMEKKLVRFEVMEKELAGLKAENTHLKAELARKDKIIAGLQQRLFGSSSEKRDPAQLQLELEELLLGKPAPPPDPSGEASAPEEEKPNAARTRRMTRGRTFNQDFPRRFHLVPVLLFHETGALASGLAEFPGEAGVLSLHIESGGAALRLWG